MAGGLSLRVGGFGGVGTTAPPEWSTPQNVASVTSAAFGPGATVQTPSASQALTPTDGFGLAFWVGVGAIAALVIIRHSLPG
jgi:hypothetical protein